MPDTRAAAHAEVARRFYEALSTGDLTLVDASLSPSWSATPALRSGGGPEGWKRSIRHLRGVFEDLEVTVEDLVVQDDRVAVRTVNRGTHRGDLLGVAGTGRRIEFRASDVHRLDGGLIVETWHLEDYFAIALQLGLRFAAAS